MRLLYSIILCMLMKLSIQQSVSAIFQNYESVAPPEFPEVTNILSSVYIENLLPIDESNMRFSLTLALVSKWNVTNLAYTNPDKEILDITSYIPRVWTPNLQITDSARDKDVLNERMILAKTGELTYSRRLMLTFYYEDLPLKDHTYNFTVYPLFYSDKYLNLSVPDVLDTGNYEFTDYEVVAKKVQVYYSDETFSGFEVKLKIKQVWNYYLYVVIIPSILFSVLSYCGFFIDKNGVPGRVYLGSLMILININAYALPRVSSAESLSNFLLGCMAFGVFAMIEYCILNYCTYTFTTIHKQIEEMVIEIQKSDLEDDHEIKVLKEVKKAGIAKVDSKRMNEEVQKINNKIKADTAENKKVTFNIQESNNEEEKKRDAIDINVDDQSSEDTPGFHNHHKHKQPVSAQINFNRMKFGQNLHEQNNDNAVSHSLVDEEYRDEIQFEEHDSPLVPDEHIQEPVMKKAKSYAPAKLDTHIIDLNSPESSDNIAKGLKMAPQKPDPKSTKQIVVESSLSDEEPIAKPVRMVSYQPGPAPVVEKRKESRKDVLSQGSRTIDLFRKVTIHAMNDLSKNAPNRGKIAAPRYHQNAADNFHKSFQKFKSQLADNPPEGLKPEVKKKINKVIEIEQSIKYRLSRHLMNRLDIFSRFLFPIVFIFWLNITLFFFDYNVPRFIILFLIVILGILVYCTYKIYQISEDRKITKWETVKYYMKGRCCRLDKTVKLA